MRVFNVPASAPFLRTVIGALVDGRLIEGFEARTDPQRLGKATLYLPTRRACRMARDVFLEVLDADAVLLPRIVAIGDIDEDEFAFAETSAAMDLAPALGALQRRLMLTPLIGKWAELIGSPNPDDPSLVVTGPVSALGLADSLARLMDDMATRQVPWEALDTLVPAEVDKYWQLTRDFLDYVVRKEWPDVIRKSAVMEPVARRDALIALEAQRLAEQPRGPVIAAGSTGSMPATAKFLDAVARLAQGAVVLPGLDMDLDDAAWQAIARVDLDGSTVFSPQAAPTHPQFAMQALLKRFGIARGEVVSLADAQGREILLSEAMRPAPTTAQWRTRLAEPTVAAGIARGLIHLSVVEAATTEEEALAIAVALRESAETPGKSAALVTPDRALARRVLAACSRWGLEVDDSGGDALMETPSGIFARLAAETALDGLAPAALLALLKHPLTRLGREADGFASEIATLEIALLRGPRPARDCAGLKKAYEIFRAEISRLRRGEESAIHPGERRAQLGNDEIAAAQALLDEVCGALTPLDEVTEGGTHAFVDLAARHRDTIARLSAGPDGDIAAFADNDGTALAEAFADIAEQGAAAGVMLPRDDYREAFTAALNDRVVRRPGAPGARLRIYGPLEARLTHCDRVILGGLVEGVWPPQTQVDPWLNRGMRAQLGLDLPERRIGLSAHDFTQLMGGPEVILTHAAKVGGAPAVASRFLHRLEAVMGKDAWTEATARGDATLRHARALDRPDEITPVRKPEPRPMRDLRPTSLSVTEIEHWLRDPYTIYARHILKLSELDPVDAAVGAADRGSAIHGAIGDFSKTFAAALPPRPLDELTRLGEKWFKPFQDEPEAKAFWWPRYLRIAQWMAGWESARRPGIVRIDAEIRGNLSFDANGRVFRLRGRADRIEQRSDGSYALLDFKTGVVPTTLQVESGLSPQLTLEGAILREGGFGDIPHGAPIAELVHVKLSGADPAGKEEPLKLAANEASDEALQNLKELVIAFEDEARPYQPMVLSMWSQRYGTYDALSRVKEWSASGGGDGE